MPGKIFSQGIDKPEKQRYDTPKFPSLTVRENKNARFP